MKHPVSREFFTYWESKRGEARAPERGDVDPSALRELLGDIFVLSYDDAATYPFRVAGTRVCALFGHDVKDASFPALFARRHRRARGRRGAAACRGIGGRYRAEQRPPDIGYYTAAPGFARRS